MLILVPQNTYSNIFDFQISRSYNLTEKTLRLTCIYKALALSFFLQKMFVPTVQVIVPFSTEKQSIISDLELHFIKIVVGFCKALGKHQVKTRFLQKQPLGDSQIKMSQKSFQKNYRKRSLQLPVSFLNIEAMCLTFTKIAICL